MTYQTVHEALETIVVLLAVVVLMLVFWSKILLGWVFGEKESSADDE